MGCLMKVAIDLLADPLAGIVADPGPCFLHYPASDEQAVLYLLRPCGHPMAYAFVGGSTALALEPESDAAIRDVVLEPLRGLLGRSAVERSFGMAAVSRWASDPFAFGSYAVARPGGAGARAVLAEPLFGRLHLAGEATAPDGWHGTASGAWLAGRKAVLRIAAAATGN
jgi:monoamine oxidase